MGEGIGVRISSDLHQEGIPRSSADIIVCARYSQTPRALRVHARRSRHRVAGVPPREFSCTLGPEDALLHSPAEKLVAAETSPTATCAVNDRPATAGEITMAARYSGRRDRDRRSREWTGESVVEDHAIVQGKMGSCICAYSGRKGREGDIAVARRWSGVSQGQAPVSWGLFRGGDCVWNCRYCWLISLCFTVRYHVMHCTLTLLFAR